MKSNASKLAKMKSNFTFTDGIILYMENPIDSTKSLLELIHESTKLQDTKPMYRNQLHSYTLIMKQQKDKQRN